MDAAVGELLREAAIRRERGQFAEAARAYAAVLSARPNLPDAWYNLAYSQRMIGAYDQALTSYDEALARGAPHPEEILVNKAVIYSDFLRDDVNAERALRTALSLAPDSVPALLNLGNLHEDRGEREAARSCYERILECDGENARALARLANALPADGGAEDLLDRLYKVVRRPQTLLEERAEAAFALGRLLDGCAHYDEAFHAYAMANELSRSQTSTAYDRDGMERLVDQIIAAFPQAVARSSALSEHWSPIFVCGMFRSGSTLAEQVISGHPRVTAGGELEMIPALARKLSPFPAGAVSLNDAQLDQFARSYRAAVSRIFPGRDLVTDKRPDNFIYLGLIKRIFPRAKIVHTVRDVMDNVLSVYFLHLDHNMNYASSLEDIAHYYVQYRRLMAHWRALYPDDILDFDYDLFVGRPKESAASLLAFLGLDWADECLAFEQRKNLVRTASVWQVREPLYTRSSGRWRHYAKHLSGLCAYLSGHGVTAG